jgi:hypothetical protein
MALSDYRLSVPMPEFLADRLRLKAELECSSVAAVARRLIALGITREAPERTTDARELAGVR